MFAELLDDSYLSCFEVEVVWVESEQFSLAQPEETGTQHEGLEVWMRVSDKRVEFVQGQESSFAAFFFWELQGLQRVVVDESFADSVVEDPSDQHEGFPSDSFRTVIVGKEAPTVVNGDLVQGNPAKHRVDVVLEKPCGLGSGSCSQL